MTDDGVRQREPIGATDEARRALNNGSGDAQAKAFELALTPAAMGFVGYWLDRWLGTPPLFLIGLALVTLVYLMWKYLAGYDAEMRAHEAKLFKPPGTQR